MYRFVGQICSYFHFDYDFVVSGISFQNLLLLSASVPRYDSKKKEESKKPVHIMDIFAGHKKSK